VLGRPKARLADGISKKFIRSGRFRSGPLRNIKTTYGWFFHLVWRMSMLDFKKINDILTVAIQTTSSD
jgi:hypothetical protein